MPYFISGEEFECEFCSLEFRSRNDWNNHIIQHFKQKNCMVCGNILIRVGDIWYGAHNSQTCDQGILTTEIITEVENTEEVILPDFVEVKAEEIYDVIDDSDVDNDIDNDVDNDMDNDIFEEAPSNSADELPQPSDDLPQPYSMKQLKKDIKLTKNNPKGPEQQLTSLTEDQLQSRICPICQKMIVNKQNLICHINIHNGVSSYIIIISISNHK